MYLFWHCSGTYCYVLQNCLQDGHADTSVKPTCCMQASAASMCACAIAREADAHLACMGAGVIGSFHPFSPLAAALVAPTQLWVTVAAKLNYDIVKLNTGKDRQI